MPVSLDQANRLIEAAFAKGLELKLAPLTVVVLDPGGHIVAVQRQDGSGILRVEIATGKAYGGLGMGFGSREWIERAAKTPAFVNAAAAASQGRMVPVPGGVLIAGAGGEVLGAVGISGDLSDNDEACAVAGIHAVGLLAKRARAPLNKVAAWFDRIDPGTHRRIKGLRLVTAYGIAALLGTLRDVSHGVRDAAVVGSLAGGFALWASVSEGRTTRAESSRDLTLLVVAAVVGAASMIELAPILDRPGWPGAEVTLVSGAFLVAYLKRYGLLGGGIGSQIFIGQLMVFGVGLSGADLGTVVLAGVIAVVAAIVPRMLSGPAEHPGPAWVATPSQGLRMGVQAAIAALAIVLLNDAIAMRESAWAITACTYVIAGSTRLTLERVRRRIVGTAVGVPLGLACLPIALHAPPVIWVAAAVAMVVYAMAMPERYDIACGAFAFTLVVTLAASGESSVALLAARAWETVIGGALGLVTAMLVLPLRAGSATR